MKGEALSWYKLVYQNYQLTTWEEFTKALTLRFGPLSYGDYQQELFKLKQTSIVVDYQACFEHLSNQVVGLSRGNVELFPIWIKP